MLGTIYSDNHGEEVKQNTEIFPETIVALATPRGMGAITIARISGDEALEIAEGLLRGSKRVHDWESRRMHLVEVLLADGSLLDRALGVIYRRPHSYTGEDVVEVFLHGSPYIAARVLERCCELGARMAEPGEFTQRAFLNGRLDLAQAEAVSDLISASSETAHRAAMAQREGSLSRRIGRIREKLLQMCSLVELEIDFSEQDVPIVEGSQILTILAEVEVDLKHLEDSFTRGRLAREGATVVIAGAPNVGKSTLFNALLGEDKAIVDEMPGTTRDAVEGLVEWEGLTIRLMDTAGQAEHFLGPDKQAVDRAGRTARAADIVLWLLDLSIGSDATLPRTDFSDRMIVVGNKADLKEANGSEVGRYVRISALYGTGLDELKASVIKKLMPAGKADCSEGILTRERHLEAVRKGMSSLSRARRVAEDNRGQELLAADLREVVGYLGEIIGEVTPEDVLHRIFADFCIGK